MSRLKRSESKTSDAPQLLLRSSTSAERQSFRRGEYFCGIIFIKTLQNIVMGTEHRHPMVIFPKFIDKSVFSLDQQERKEEKLRERIQVLEEEKEELKELKRRGRKKEEGGGRDEKDEKGKECVEDTERMLLAVLRELEGIPRYNPLKKVHLQTPGF